MAKDKGKYRYVTKGEERALDAQLAAIRPLTPGGGMFVKNLREHFREKILGDLEESRKAPDHELSRFLQTCARLNGVPIDKPARKG